MDTSETLKDAAFLKSSVRIFKDFSLKVLTRLVSGSVTKSYEAKEAIGHYGAEALHLGVILCGAVSASLPDDHGGREIVGNFTAGDTFGEAALMTGSPSLTDLVAESRSTILLVPLSLFVQW